MRTKSIHKTPRPDQQSPAQSADTIAAFFDTYRLPQVKEQLWEYITGLMQSQQADAYTGNERVNALTFCRHLEQCLEAAWILHGKPSKRKRNEHK